MATNFFRINLDNGALKIWMIINTKILHLTFLHGQKLWNDKNGNTSMKLSVIESFLKKIININIQIISKVELKIMDMCC